MNLADHVADRMEELYRQRFKVDELEALADAARVWVALWPVHADGNVDTWTTEGAAFVAALKALGILDKEVVS